MKSAKLNLPAGSGKLFTCIGRDLQSSEPLIVKLSYEVKSRQAVLGVRGIFYGMYPPDDSRDSSD